MRAMTLESRVTPEPDSQICRFAACALELVESSAALPYFSAKKSPKKFTQHQLAACALMRAWLGISWRRLEDLLATSAELREGALGLRRVPDHSTLAAFFARVFAGEPRLVELLVARSAALASNARTRSRSTGGSGSGGEEQEPPPPVDLALDSTGLGTSSASGYYLRRRGGGRGPWRRYVKISLAVEAHTWAIWAAVPSFGPTQDLQEASDTLSAARRGLLGASRQARRLWADSAYDSERFHGECERLLGATSWVPPRVRRADGLVLHGPDRARCFARIERQESGYALRRTTAEGAISALKRTTGPVVRARRADSQLAEAALKAVAWNLRLRRAQNPSRSSRQNRKMPVPIPPPDKILCHQKESMQDGGNCLGW